MSQEYPHYRRNFIAFLGDYVGFGMAMTFASSTTILPDFVGQLSGSEIVVGLLTTVHSGSWLLPQLFFARFLANKPRKKRYVSIGAAIGRPFYFLYALLLWFGVLRNSLLALVLFFLLQVVFLSTDSLAAVAWFDVLGKAFPEGRRGRLIGTAQAIRGGLAFAAGGLIAAILGENGMPFPQNYAAIFAMAGGSLLFSLFSWSFVVEPNEPVEAEVPSWRDFLPELRRALQQDGAFRRVILVRLLTGFDVLAMGFYIRFATENLGLAREVIGAYTTVHAIGGIAASVALGAVSELKGNHRVIQLAATMSLTAPMVGLVLFFLGFQGELWLAAVFGWTFLVLGVVLSSNMLGLFNYVLDLAPSGKRPTYVGLFNTISGLLILLPPLGGWLLESTSYGVLFAITGIFVAAGALLSWKLPPGRRAQRIPEDRIDPF
jgi:MFS family permease